MPVSALLPNFERMKEMMKLLVVCIFYSHTTNIARTLRETKRKRRPAPRLPSQKTFTLGTGRDRIGL